VGSFPHVWNSQARKNTVTEKAINNSSSRETFGLENEEDTLAFCPVSKITNTRKGKEGKKKRESIRGEKSKNRYWPCLIEGIAGRGWGGRRAMRKGKFPAIARRTGELSIARRPDNVPLKGDKEPGNVERKFARQD